MVCTERKPINAQTLTTAPVIARPRCFISCSSWCVCAGPNPPELLREPLSRLLGRIATIHRRDRARRTHEQLLAIREAEVATIGPERSVFRLVAVDDDFGPDGQRLSRKTTAKQRIRGSAFNHPALDGAIRLLHIQMDPRMRIDPF